MPNGNDLENSSGYTTDINSVRVEFAYQLRDMIQAKKDLRKLNLADRIFYRASKIIIGILLAPVLLGLVVVLILHLHRLILSPSLFSKDDLHGFLSLLFFVIGLAIYLTLRRYFRRRKDLALQRKIRIFNLTTQGLIVTEGDVRTEVAWSFFQRFNETDDLFLLRNQMLMVTLPKRVLTPEQLHSVHDLLHAHFDRTYAFPVLPAKKS